MLILAIDTAGTGCSACLWRDGTVLAAAGGSMERGQAEALMPMLEAVMTEAKARESDIGWKSLDRIAVTVGPGSFTGVRIGLSAARGLGLAAGCPVIGITTTEAYAETVTAAEGTIVSIIDARREEIYLQAFRASDHVPLGEAVMLAPGAVAAALQPLGAAEPWHLTGDGLGMLAGLPEWADRLPPEPAELLNPAVVARLAAPRAIPDQPPGALYIRPPDAAIPLHGGRLRG